MIEVQDMRHELDHWSLLAGLVTRVGKRQSSLYNTVLRRFGLNGATYSVLMMIHGADNQITHPSSLADATGERSTRITHLCDQLLQRGLIERTRSTADRRRVVLRLSQQGQRLVETIQPEMWNALRPVSAGFDAMDLQRLATLLQRMLTHLAGPK